MEFCGYEYEWINEYVLMIIFVGKNECYLGFVFGKYSKKDSCGYYDSIQVLIFIHCIVFVLYLDDHER